MLLRGRQERLEHDYVGDRQVCLKCGYSRDRHRSRPEHEFVGNEEVCLKCGHLREQHRERERKSRPEHEFKRSWDDFETCITCGHHEELHRNRARRFRKDSDRKYYIGIDGEGKTTGAFHRYTLLGASNEDGSRRSSVEPFSGFQLTTRECLDFIVTLPTKHAQIFAFSFGYDLTKILTDLDNRTLYRLFRPEERRRAPEFAMLGPRPEVWQEYALNLQGTKFSIFRRGYQKKASGRWIGARRIVIWDIWKFYQTKFVNALKEWKVGTPELLKRMTRMKDMRAEFADKATDDEIRNYCLEECACMATLARKLVEAHTGAGLKLTSFYGAGSSGTAMLKKMGIKEKIKAPPPEMNEAVFCGFFGGRFENSVIGRIDGPLYNYDISSAYPYQTTFLPCLLHATWERTTDRKQMEVARTALVRYEFGRVPNASISPIVRSWGPFPFRTKDGSITFPIKSGGGWVWKDEYLTGEALFSHVIFKEAWVYKSTCNCQPFGQIPKFYLERIKLGKEGPGIVIKLAVNSCYGKLAQSVGSAPFNSWIWAGLITSGCRAQINRVIALHEDYANLLMIATDGIYTRERFFAQSNAPHCYQSDATKYMPIPLDTGTNIYVMGVDGKMRDPKPLGGWEEKVSEKGLFVARPGIYFPLHPSEEEIKDVRGRGVGKSTILKQWQKIVDAWEQYGNTRNVKIADIRLFCGAKTTLTKSLHATGGYRRAEGYGQEPRYGQWISRKVEMSFDPLPKRAEINPDGITLALRSFPASLKSVPYDRAMLSDEARDLKAAEMEIAEQPDPDYSDYGFFEGDCA